MIFEDHHHKSASPNVFGIGIEFKVVILFSCESRK